MSLPLDEWLIKSAKEIATTGRESINKLQKKVFVAVLTRVKGEEQEPKQTAERIPPAGSAIQNLVDVKRFILLTQLVKNVAWVWRAAKRFLGEKGVLNNPLGGSLSNRSYLGERKRGRPKRCFSCHTDGRDLSKHHNKVKG